MPQRRTPAAPSTSPLRTDAELHTLALSALAERHGGQPTADTHPAEYDEIMRAFKGSRRLRAAALTIHADRTHRMSARKKAVIYLRTQQEEPSAAELDRLAELRRFANSEEYEVVATRIACDPFDSDATEPPTAYTQSRQEIQDRKADAIVLWHEDRGVPDTLTYEDIARTAPRSSQHPNVAAYYTNGEEIKNFHIVEDTDLSHESTADVVVTLALALDELSQPDTFDYTRIARKVAGLWRDASRRGVTLT